MFKNSSLNFYVHYTTVMETHGLEKQCILFSVIDLLFDHVFIFVPIVLLKKKKKGIWPNKWFCEIFAAFKWPIMIQYFMEVIIGNNKSQKLYL